MKSVKDMKSVKKFIYAASLFFFSVNLSSAQAAFQNECNAYITLRGHVLSDSSGWRYSSTSAPNNPGNYSVLILPDIGIFAVGQRNNNSPYSAVPMNDAEFEKLIAHYLTVAPKDSNLNQAVSGTMSKFECIARNEYLKSTLDTMIADVTQRFEASETRVRDALLRGFSGEIAMLTGGIDAIRREIPSLPQRDREELNERLTFLETQVEAALKDICVAIKLDEGQR